jgi:mRNA interferase RelE/StbE
MYKILIHEVAQKQIEKLPKTTQERIFKVLNRISIRPFHFAKRLVGSNYYRLRLGDYRIIIDINQNTMTIIVIEIGHRKSVYK